MTYSCTDFTDTILDALGIVVPEEAMDDPSAQADLALGAISALRAGEQAIAILKAVASCPQAAPWLVRMPFGDGNVLDAIKATIAAGTTTTYFVCAIETKYIEDWRLFRTEEAARAHLKKTARDVCTDTYGDGADMLDHDGMPFNVVEWFQGRDSTHVCEIMELTVED